MDEGKGQKSNKGKESTLVSNYATCRFWGEAGEKKNLLHLVRSVLSFRYFSYYPSSSEKKLYFVVLSAERGMEILIALHKDNARQGPGSDEFSKMAATLTGLPRDAPLKIADIGCGTGASTLLLAKEFPNAHITAVDFLPEFLAVLTSTIGNDKELSSRITPLAKSMTDLPFEEAQFDLIWSEGAIYNMGFQAGVKAWAKYLKPGGILAASELTWITGQRPEELTTHWEKEYPEVDVASGKFSVLEKHGYSPVGYLVLPESCWIDEYYAPLERRFDVVAEEFGNSDEVMKVIEGEKAEIAMYKKYREYFSYGFYVAKKMV